MEDTLLLLHFIDLSKSQGQLKLKEWRNKLHLLIGVAVSHCKRHVYKDGILCSYLCKQTTTVSFFLLSALKKLFLNNYLVFRNFTIVYLDTDFLFVYLLGGF